MYVWLDSDGAANVFFDRTVIFRRS